MNKNILTFAFLALPMTPQSVDEIVSKSLVASGKTAHVKAIQTVRLSGLIIFGKNEPSTFLVEMKRPGKMRNEIGVKNKTTILVTDGHNCWNVDSVYGDGTLQALSAERLKNMAGGADFEGPLMDWKAKGNKIEFIGTEKINGRDAFKLRVTLKDGEIRHDYIDCVSYLETKWEGHVSSDGKAFGVESYFRDYRDEGGVMFASEIVSDTPGKSYDQKIVFDKIEVNGPIDDARFGKPLVSASVSAETKSQ